LRTIDYSTQERVLLPVGTKKTTIQQSPTPQIHKKATKTNSIIHSFVFLVKYIATTATIFAALMITTNYQAYYQIAKSYFNAEQIAASEQ
jgi:hypothetical protein